MKRTILLYTLLIQSALFILPAEAQKVVSNQLKIGNSQLVQKGDSLKIYFELNFSDMEINKDQSVTLIPMLSAPGQEMALPPVKINGKRRQLVYEREIALNAKKRNAENLYAVLNKRDDSVLSLNYDYTTAYEVWMEDARLDLVEDLCGCAGEQQQLLTHALVDGVSLEAVPVLNPHMTFIRPEIEEIKRRSEQHDAFLDFQVGKTAIVPTYMNNPRELNKIESILKELRNDQNLSVTRVSIRGFASPEGSIELNNRLSSGRAEALRLYLSSRAEFPEGVYCVDQGGEDWKGLEELVEASYMEHKNEVLAVIRSGQSLDAREQSLKKIGGGTAYQYMLKEFYPQLRRVLCQVDYTVRGFNVNEAKEIIRKRPQLLSLEEMFLVANTYEVTDKEFAEVFEIAVRLYPDNEVANLNAAASALQWGNTERAKQYLDNVSSGSKGYANNMGVYYLLTGDLVKARETLSQAKQNGDVNAEHNLNELGIQMKTKQ